MSSNGKLDCIIVSYGGTHQAYYHALAAQEAGRLSAFLCSIYDGNHKWGSRLSKVLGSATLANRRIEGFDVSKAVEYPWPLLWSRLLERMGKKGNQDWLWMTHQVDRWSARWLEQNPCGLLVASETGAYHSFQAAKQHGAICLLDCPQAHPEFLTRLLATAAADLGVPSPPPFDRPDVAERKQAEFEMADHLLMTSSVQQRSFVEAGFDSKKISVIPYSIDSKFWRKDVERPKELFGNSRPLRVLFVGGIGLRKGIPYLLRAVESLGKHAELWLVGPNSGEVDLFLGKSRAQVRLLGRKTKEQLREVYREADVFVLPSLIDTFGYVVMEAMACGTPTIVTENCGAPVPDSSWRVPIMNSEALAARLGHYLDHPKDLELHGVQANAFAKQFTPEKYREQVGKLFLELLEKRAS